MIQPSFADRAIRDAFRHPDNLREFLLRTCPELPATADYAAAEHLDREFYLEDLEKREPDLVIKVPVQTTNSGAASEFFIIIEHQSRPQQRIAYRIAQYCLMLWRQRLRTDPNPSPFRLPPIIPILLHTHPPAWTDPPPLQDLIQSLPGLEDLSAELRFRYLDVPALNLENLLSSRLAFDLYLSVLPIGPSRPDHCEEVLTKALLRLEALMISRARFMDIVRSVLQWTYARQSREHRNGIIKAAANKLSPENRSLTMSIHEHVAKSLDDELIESCTRSYAEGEARGEARGEVRGEARGKAVGQAEGRANGAMIASRFNLLTVLNSRFGQIPESITHEIESMRDTERLNNALILAATVPSIGEFSL